MRILKLTEDTRKDILQNLLKRSPNNYGEFEGRVNAIIEEVRNNRDQAVFNYTKQFDGADINAGNILVTEEEIAEAYEQVDTTLLAVIRKSLVNIKKYHEKQVQNSWFTTEDGIILGQKVTALATVGVYVPGGKAVYPSSVLMNVLPAKVAGVDRIVMCTPPGKDGKVYPSTLVAAKEAGVDEIYKVGGAQAIAAMAFGTERLTRLSDREIFMSHLPKKQCLVMSALIPLQDRVRFWCLRMRLQIHAMLQRICYLRQNMMRWHLQF